MTDPRIVVEARKHYLSGHSIKETCERFSLSIGSLSKRATREGWKQQRDKIEQSQATLAVKLSEETVKKTSDLASSLASKQIADHITTMVTGSMLLRDKLLDNIQLVNLPVCLDHQSTESLARTIDRVDTNIRRSLGLNDVQEVKVSGSIESTMNILVSCQAIQAKGEAVPVVDVDALLIEAKGCDK